MKTFKCKYCNNVIEQGTFCNIGAAMVSHYAKCEYNPNHKKFIEDKVKAGKVGGVVWSEKCKLEKEKDEASRSNRKFICERCGQIYIKKLTDKELKIYNKNEHRFCSRSCANTHLNRSKDSRNKVRLSIMRKNFENDNHGYATFEEYVAYRKMIKDGIFCSYPGCYNKIKFNSKTGYCKEHMKHSKLLSQIRRDATIKCFKEGKIKGWQTRNITSYPENFWKKVLQNNHINYEFNYPIHKRSLGFENALQSTCYFLDFKIGNNVDLEIDGNQHLDEDRKEHDKIRDKALTSHGWKVYRIPWNEINSKNGKLQMKKKIDDFLNWYKKQV